MHDTITTKQQPGPHLHPAYAVGTHLFLIPYHFALGFPVSGGSAFRFSTCRLTTGPTDEGLGIILLARAQNFDQAHESPLKSFSPLILFRTNEICSSIVRSLATVTQCCEMQDGKAKHIDTRGSPVVPDQSTNLAQRCLPAVC